MSYHANNKALEMTMNPMASKLLAQDPQMFAFSELQHSEKRDSGFNLVSQQES
jgi:hypothetical protein